MFKKVQDKRADNVTAEGRVFLAVKPDGSEAAMVEIQCESAPVATGEVMQQFGQAMVDTLLSGPGAADAATLMSQKGCRGCSHVPGTVRRDRQQDPRKDRCQSNRASCRAGRGLCPSRLQNRRVVHCLRNSKECRRHEGRRNAYRSSEPNRHSAGTTGPEIVQAERDRLVAEARASKKPENIIEKMVDGRMKVFYAEQGVLTMQPFAKDDSKTVSQALAEAGLEAVTFHRWKVGA
jgi:elongation factor Ts